MPKVETYTIAAGTGRRIRKATRVRFDDGTLIEFMEKMGKRKAIRQAEYMRDSRSPYWDIARRVKT
jgi:hypothetical protein